MVLTMLKKAAQDISVKTEFKKTYGNKAFSLKAKLKKGNGTLSYVSKQPSIAAVNKKTGKVTIKGTGIAKIVITASETNTYKKKTKGVTIKVAPKKVTLTEVKSKSKYDIYLHIGGYVLIVVGILEK